MMLRRPVQLALPHESKKGTGHGGARPGAGRKPTGRRVVPHVARGAHRARHPVHVTLRAREGLPSFRADKFLFAALRGAIADGQKRAFRIVHFSVQSNHLHLIVEAHDTETLSRGLQGLTVRMARAVNRALAACGTVFAERYHAHELRTPRETRAALLYVLQNWAKHGPGGDYDPWSSAAWFDGWSKPPPTGGGLPVVARPRTWLVTIGWRRHGLLRPGEKPGRAAVPLPA
jgi:REP element-mobilizing transposase RayT